MRFPVVLAAGLALALAPISAAAQDAIGLRLFVQPWDIATDNDTPMLAHDSPSTLSDAIFAAWSARKAESIQSITERLGTGDLLGEGFTLHDITLRLGDPSVSLSRVSGSGPEPMVLRADGMGTFYLEASITTPGPAPAATDPRCVVSGTLQLATEITLGTNPQQLFSASRARIPEAVRLPDLALDHQGLTCSVLLAIVDIAGFEGRLKQIIRQQAEPHILAAFDAAMGQSIETVNTTLAALVPDGLGRTGAWFLPSASGDTLVLAMGVLGPVPDTGPPATIQGTVTGAGTVAACEIPLSFRRKVGPRPLDALGTPGDPPLEPLATIASCDPPDASGQRRFRVQGLSSVLPNYVESSGFRCGRDQNVLTTFRSGNVEKILSSELDRPIDIELSPMGRGIPCNVNVEPNLIGQDIRDLIIDPLADPFPVPGFDETIITTPQGQIRFRNRQAQELNPQPLPPAEISRQIDSLQRSIQIQQNRLDLLRGQIGR